MSPFVLVPAIFFIAGLMQGLTGFGCALIAMPLLTYVVDIKIAVPVCTLCAMFINLNMTYKLRKSLDKAKILPLLIGSVPGSIFGTVVLKEVNGDYIRLLLGVLISGFAAYSLLARPIKLHISDRWGYLSGFLTGAIHAAVSAGGPPTIIYSSLRGWDKDSFKATLVAFFMASGIMAAAGHLLSGLTTIYIFKLFMASTLPIVMGTLAGGMISGLLSEDFYRRIVMVLLVIMGLMLIFQNV
ncbi:sulfite exporter TauE/SafE family protein [Maridesulfovibrio sp.]|uniref:sulfite exporter TauE/SafE family protein n=1 Tax=unclassified Maridesulfovibrio TaxID=2794999 RepID=UPI003B004460